MTMQYQDQEIVFSAHALSYIPTRGYALDEAKRAIKEQQWSATDHNRLETRMDFPFRSIWNGKVYETKQVRPIFVVEGKTITVITVYTYYF